MFGVSSSRRLLLLFTLMASQSLTACVVIPAPYHRHRPYVIEPYPGNSQPAPFPPRAWRPHRDRNAY